MWVVVEVVVIGDACLSLRYRLVVVGDVVVGGAVVGGGLYG